jgi:hypothetical protein
MILPKDIYPQDYEPKKGARSSEKRTSAAGGQRVLPADSRNEAGYQGRHIGSV